MTFPIASQASGRFSTAWPTLNSLGANSAVALVTLGTVSTTITDSTNTGSGDNVWVAGAFVESQGSPYRAQFFYCLNLVKKSATHQISDSAGNVSTATVAFWALNAPGTVSLVAGSNLGAQDATFGGTSAQPGSFNPTPENDTLRFVGVGGNAFGATRAVNSGFTLSVSDVEHISATLNEATATALNPAITWVGSSRWAVTSLVLKYGAAPTPVITGPSGAAGAASSTASVAENATTGPAFSASVALGAGYPTLTGVDATRWAITALTATTWRVDPSPAKNFEDPLDIGANNVHDVVFNASATVSQACAITITNVIELPGAPTIGIATAGNTTATGTFTPPAAGTAPPVIDYRLTASPSGLFVEGVASPLTIIGLTNNVAQTLSVTARNSDGTGPASAASNSVTPTAGGVAPTFTGIIPAKTGTIGIAFAFGTPTLASYYTGAANVYSASVALPAGLVLDAATAVISGTPTGAASVWTGTITAANGTAPNATSNSFTITIGASSDTTPPTLAGVVTASAVTSNSATISWPAGADNVGVTGYDYRLNAGAYVVLGNVTTTPLSGLLASTLYACDVRARDAAGNVSTPVISGSFTTTAAPPPPPLSGETIVDPIYNNTLSGPTANTPMRWTWFPGGRVGALNSPQHGTATTDANGSFSRPVTGAGVLVYGVFKADATTDEVAYQAFAS